MDRLQPVKAAQILLLKQLLDEAEGIGPRTTNKSFRRFCVILYNTDCRKRNQHPVLLVLSLHKNIDDHAWHQHTRPDLNHSDTRQILKSRYLNLISCQMCSMTN